jgi:hypothetical protein
MDMRAVVVRIFLPLTSRVKINTLHLEASPEEYTDDLKVKWDGYESRRGKNYFAIDFKGRN